MALATYTIVAWRLLWLTYHSRINPQQPCDTVLETHEWQRQSPQVGKPAHGAGSSLCATIQKTPKPLKHPPSLRDAIRMIAALGGFLGRKSDGEPGVKTIWRGLRRLHDIALTWKLLYCDSPSAFSVNVSEAPPFGRLACEHSNFPRIHLLPFVSIPLIPPLCQNSSAV
jgi:hypothetical protein